MWEYQLYQSREWFRAPRVFSEGRDTTSDAIAVAVAEHGLRLAWAGAFWGGRPPSLCRVDSDGVRHYSARIKRDTGSWPWRHVAVRLAP